MKYETMLEAARGWVNGFNAFPLGMIEKIYNIDYDFTDITPVTKYSRVWSNEYQECGEVTDIKEDEDGNEIIKVEFDNGEDVETERDDLSREDNDYFPMWGTLWQFNDSCDNWWLENNLEEIAACGLEFMNLQNLVISLELMGLDMIFMKHIGSLYTRLEVYSGMK